CDHDHHHDHDHAHEHHHHHDHEHGPGCDHEHHHEHEHVHAAAAPGDDDGHEHGWGPWRYAVLLLPVVLFCLHLPNEGFSSTFSNSSVDITTDTLPDVAEKGVPIVELNFKELQSAAYNPDQRQAYEGRTIRIRGQLSPSGNDSIFKLVRFKIN